MSAFILVSLLLIDGGMQQVRKKNKEKVIVDIQLILFTWVRTCSLIPVCWEILKWFCLFSVVSNVLYFVVWICSFWQVEFEEKASAVHADIVNHVGTTTNHWVTLICYLILVLEKKCMQMDKWGIVSTSGLLDVDLATPRYRGCSPRWPKESPIRGFFFDAS
jgi:hypothetical protein